MKLAIRKSVVNIVGKIWMPNMTAAQTLEMTNYDVNNARDEEGKITRESVQRWLDMNARDFSSVLDFWASIEDGSETVEIPWGSEESEMTYNDCTFGDEE